MPYCDNCGAHVSSDWKRVVEVDGEIPQCPECHRSLAGSSNPKH